MSSQILIIEKKERTKGQKAGISRTSPQKLANAKYQRNGNRNENCSPFPEAFHNGPIPQ
jgi:hypothetical protein